MNVVKQRPDPGSLLNYMQRVIYMRRQNREIGRGEFRVIEASDPGVFAHCCEWENGTVVVVHNLASKPCTAELDSGEMPEPIIEIFGNRDYNDRTRDLRHVELDAYGYRWFRCGGVRL